MVLHVAKNRFSSEVEHISFPADAEKVRYAVIGLEEFGGWSPAHIIGGEGAANILTGYIKRDELFSEDGVQKLNRLSELVDAMDMEAQNIFAGALRLENTDNLDDVLRIAGSLDHYMLFPNIKTDEELGHYLVDIGPVTGKFVFAEEVKPYLDYAKIGAEQRIRLGGAHTTQGFVTHREEAQTQKVEAKSKFSLTLGSPTGTVRLDLPAFEDDLEQAKKALGLDSLDSAVIRDAEIGYAWAHLIPMGGITLEDADKDGILDPTAPDFERRYWTLRRMNARFRVLGHSWWPEEMPSDAEYAEAETNLERAGWCVDCVLTHCAPSGILPQIDLGYRPNPLTDFLEIVRQRCRFSAWFLGHYHTNQVIDGRYILQWEQISKVE